MFNNKKNNTTFSNKKIFIYIGIILAFVGLSVGFYYIYGSFSVDEKDNSTSQETIADNYKAAYKIASEEGVESSQSFLDEKLNNSTSQAEKSQIYIDKASIASSYLAGSDNSEALTYFYEAEKLVPTEKTASAIASLEENNGNISNAIKYYKLYIERASADSESDDYIYNLARLNDLEKIDK